MLMGHLTEEGTKTEVFMNPQDQRTHDYITGKFG
jgi:ABC-type phosphate transport system ATPase subunit